MLLRGWDDWQGDEVPEEATPPVQAPKRRWGKEEAGHQKGRSLKIMKLPKPTPRIKKCKFVGILTDIENGGACVDDFDVPCHFSGRYFLTILDLAVQF